MTTRIFLRTETRALLWPSDGNAYVHREWVPPPPLGRYVECVRYGVECFATEQRERVLPDGSIHLVICHGDTTEAVVVGGRCAPTMLRLSGRLEHVGVQLRPGAIAAVLGVPAAELTGYDVPLERLWGSLANVMLERLAEAPLHERPAIVGTTLMERIGAIDASHNPLATSAVTKILASAGKARVPRSGGRRRCRRAKARADLQARRGTVAEGAVARDTLPARGRLHVRRAGA
jgi:hypothetical protein